MHWSFLRFDDLTTRDLYALLRLRSEVFVVEQDCVYQDLDGRDPEAFHLLCCDGRQLLAYLRVFPPDASGEAVLGRVVVDPRWRGQGLGRELMKQGAARVRAVWGPCPLRLSAQAHLEAFYTRLGYRVVGEGYLEDGIPHLPMRCNGPMHQAKR